MLSLEAELFEHLRAGGTLAVSSRQRAAAVQLAYAQARLAAGDQTWPSPDVLPLSAFVTRESIGQRHQAAQCPRRLTAVEEWALWRDAALEAGIQLQLLSASALVDALRANHRLLDECGVQQGVLATPEGEWLLRTRRRYQQRRAALSAEDSDAWRQDTTRFVGNVLLAHPEECGQATRRALVTRGVALYRPPAAEPAPIQVVIAHNGDGEYELMAIWARRQLEQDPAARLLLVVPALGIEINRIQQVLEEQLHEQAIAGEASDAASYAIEGGFALTDSPLIQAALAALRLAASPQAFADAAFLLRSPSLGGEHTASRLELEQLARERGLTTADWPELAALAASEPLAGCAWLAAAANQVRAWPQQAAPSRWARLFAELWQHLGWPGSSALSSADQQRRTRFDERVGEFASLDEPLGLLPPAQAIDALTAWVADARLEPASGDVPVTVTSRLDDPLVSYDAIWVAGMTAESWPPPAEYSGYIAAAALQQVGHLRASADGQLALAQRSMLQWSRRARQLLYSWARVSGESQASPSPLLAGLPVSEMQAELSAPRAGLLQRAEVIEACGPDVARPWPVEQRARGGVALLQSQSHCPFQATARWRLGCEPLHEPVAGVDPRLHGEIVHGALRQLWTQLADSTALRMRPTAEWAALAAAAVRQAIADVCAGRGRVVDGLAWEVEQRRCEQLLLAALELERERPTFKVEHAEDARQLQLGVLQLRMRLDRVDLLEPVEPGKPPQRVLIDYKTGPRERTDWESMRPRQVQLQAYAQLVDDLCATVTLHLHQGRAAWAGVADSAERIANVKAAKRGWPELQRQWRELLHSLGRQFAAGVATVDPLKTACQYCELQLLCRVDAEVLAENLAAADAEAEAGDE